MLALRSSPPPRRLGILIALLIAMIPCVVRAQDTEPVDEQAAQQLDAIQEAARERVGEAAEAVGEGLRGLFGAARERVGAAARNVEERVREAVTGQPRRRDQVMVREMIAIAPAQAAIVNDAQIDQMAQQLRPFLRSELTLVREVCAPSDDQLAKLKEAGDKTLRQVAEPYAGNGVMVRSDQPEPGPAERIQEGLEGAVREVLDAEQLARYAEEAEARDADRRRVAIRNLVAYIDQKVLLSASQRDALSRSLDDNWNASWYPALELFRFGDQYLPNLPDPCVLPVLDETQKRIWQARRQNNSVIHFGGMVSQPVANEALDETEPADGGNTPAQIRSR